MRRRRFLVLLTHGAAACAGGSTPELPPAPEPERERAPAPPTGPLEALAQRLRAERERDGFTVVTQPPFVVVGDEAPDVVRRRAASTVGWATARLKDAYFDRDPPDPPTVWLFRDDRSYRHWAEVLFGDDPDTPYGYYTATHNALVMNISTGGGTLVHELVHPFIDANFPRCPAWFDEGLASLYEQCGERDGEIVGYENWRLPGLQAHIEAGTRLTFEALTHTSREAFYADDTGIHYAQARYLCFYLQEQGLLRRYYRGFFEDAEADPTGYATLHRTLGTADMRTFERAWDRFVMELRFG